MEVHNYSDVFRIESRIHRPGPDPSRHWTIEMLLALIPVGGIATRGTLYFAVALLLTLPIQLTPLAPRTLFLVFCVHICLPLWAAAAGVMFDPDGRRSDRFMHTTARFWWRRLRRRLDRGRRYGGKLKVGWRDASSTRLEQIDIYGPCHVRFNVPVEKNDRWNGTFAEGGKGEPQVIKVLPHERLRVRP